MGYASFHDAIVGTTTQLVDRVVGFVPNMVSAAVLLLIGWLVAWIARASISRLMRATLNRLGRSKMVGHALEKTQLPERVPWLAGTFMYWIILLFFAAAAVEELQLTVASDMMSQLAQYVPKVLLGVAVIIAGVVAGKMAYSAIAKAADSANIAYGPILARSVEVVVVFLAVVLGADQMGIRSALLTAVVTILAGALLGGVALAFGLGARLAVSNIISSHYLSRVYELGQKVRIAGTEGRILEFNRAGVVLEAAEGRVLVPARRFSEETSVLIEGGS